MYVCMYVWMYVCVIVHCRKVIETECSFCTTLDLLSYSAMLTMLLHWRISLLPGNNYYYYCCCYYYHYYDG